MQGHGAIHAHRDIEKKGRVRVCGGRGFFSLGDPGLFAPSEGCLQQATARPPRIPPSNRR